MSVPKQGQATTADQKPEDRGIINFCDPPTIMELKKGDQKQRIFVHEKVVRSRSKRLDSIFNHAIIDSDGRHKVTLDNVDPNLMLAYIYWLYFGKVFCECIRGDVYKFLAYLYIFALEFKDTAFQEAVTEATFEQIQKLHKDGQKLYPGGSVEGTIYNSTAPESTARQFLVNVWRTQGKPESLDWSEEKIPAEVPADLAPSFMFNLQDMPREMILESDGRPVLDYELASGESKKEEGEDNQEGNL